jgi:FMN reductase
MSVSRLMARESVECFERHGAEVRYLDLREFVLPLCDADCCYSEPNVVKVTEWLREAQGVLLSTPVYNYSVSASAKNFIELTGSAWTEKVVGFLCAAGGRSSYMAPMGVANSLMLDFRCLVLPRFVYATENAFANGAIQDEAIHRRVGELVESLVRVTRAFHSLPSEADGRL